MKKKKYILILLVVILVISIYTFTRDYELENCMSYQQLSTIVERDLIVFKEKVELPDELLNKLAEYKVVLLGEKHYIKEYAEFLPHLTLQLHQKHNFNTLLIEAPQAYSWIYEDYVQGIIPWFNDEQSKFAAITCYRLKPKELRCTP